MIDLYKDDNTVDPNGIPLEDQISEKDIQALKGITFDKDIMPTDEEQKEIFGMLFGDEFSQAFGKKFNPYHEPHSGRFTSGAAVAGSLMEAVHTNGGFTYQPETGASPKEGLALSIYPERSKIIDALKIQGSDLRGYIEKNLDILNDHTNFLGAWHDTDSGRVFLDISKVVKTDAEARKLCEQHGQRAYFNLKTFETVDVVPESEAHKMYKARKNKVRLIHIPVDASDRKLEEIAAKIRKAQEEANKTR